MRVALIGGTFNPLHIGHAMLAETAATELGYDKVIIVPAFIPPHKLLTNAPSAEDRLGMVRAFCETSEHFIAEDCEIKRGGVSYTYDTLTFIMNKYGKAVSGRPALIMGQETAAEFDKWYHVDEIVQTADIIIARRHRDTNKINTTAFENIPSGAYTGGYASDSIFETFRYPHRVLPSPVMPLSSTEIRARIAEGKSWRYLVPEPVFQYIIERKLYGYK